MHNPLFFISSFTTLSHHFFSAFLSSYFLELFLPLGCVYILVLRSVASQSNASEGFTFLCCIVFGVLGYHER